ncbi:MAG: response regulator, partial [Epsilonproteobacteria bacterium]|nr:response regulator [Campylobacterota bacterium]
MDKKDLKLVIVDDSKVSYMMLKTMLANIGFTNIEYFEYPLDYIEYLKTVPEDGIDIVFIDYEMPTLNGLKVLRYTKDKRKEVIAVMMTASTDTKVKEKAIKYGVNEFMNKGIDPFEFKTKMDVLANLRFYYYESKEHHKELENILKYKDAQET